MFNNESEYRYFDYFITQPATCLRGYFDPSCANVWVLADRLLLQASYYDKFVRHGIVAIAALNKTMETSSLSSALGLDTGFETLEEKRHRTFALQQYAKALTFMRQSATLLLDEYHLRNILLGCLLTTAIETYQGNYQKGVAQAKAGVKLLSDFQQRRSIRPSLSPETSTIDSDIVTAFSHMERLILKVANANRHQDFNSFREGHGSEFLRSQPNKFESLKQARLYWNINIRRAIMWGSVSGMNSTQKGTENSSQGQNEVHRGVSLIMRAGLDDSNAIATAQRASSMWSNAFRPLLEKCRTQPRSNRLYQGATTLMIKHLSVLSLYSGYALDEHHTEDAKWLLQMAGELLEYASSDEGGQQRAARQKNFEDSIVAALFLVATRCRHRKTRREAIALLRKYPRREGLWDSVMAATVGQWLVDTEEMGLCEDEYVPLDCRLVIVMHEVLLSDRKAIVQCKKQGDAESRKELCPLEIVMW